MRLRPCWRNHVWSYDFVADHLVNGKKLKFMTVIDEYSRKCLALKVGHKLTSSHVLEVLSDLFISEGMPDYFRSDNVLY